MFCYKCGRQIDQTDSYCPYCGVQQTPSTDTQIIPGESVGSFGGEGDGSYGSNTGAGSSYGGYSSGYYNGGSPLIPTSMPGPAPKEKMPLSAKIIICVAVAAIVIGGGTTAWLLSNKNQPKPAPPPVVIEPSIESGQDSPMVTDIAPSISSTPKQDITPEIPDFTKEFSMVATNIKDRLGYTYTVALTVYSPAIGKVEYKHPDNRNSIITEDNIYIIPYSLTITNTTSGFDASLKLTCSEYTFYFRSPTECIEVSRFDKDGNALFSEGNTWLSYSIPSSQKGALYGYISFEDYTTPNTPSGLQNTECLVGSGWGVDAKTGIMGIGSFSFTLWDDAYFRYGPIAQCLIKKDMDGNLIVTEYPTEGWTENSDISVTTTYYNEDGVNAANPGPVAEWDSEAANPLSAPEQEPESKPAQTQPPTPVPSTLRLSEHTLPPDQKIGAIFGVRGIIESNYLILSVTVAVCNDFGIAETEKTVYPDAYTYDIKNVDFDILFDILTVGNKTYLIEATDEVGSKTLLSYPFRVTS